jgi:hypothetical protein
MNVRRHQKGKQRKSKKNREYNGKEKRQKDKQWSTKPHWKPTVNSGTPEG